MHLRPFGTEGKGEVRNTGGHCNWLLWFGPGVRHIFGTTFLQSPFMPAQQGWAFLLTEYQIDRLPAILPETMLKSYYILGNPGLPTTKYAKGITVISVLFGNIIRCDLASGYVF